MTQDSTDTEVLTGTDTGDPGVLQGTIVPAATGPLADLAKFLQADNLGDTPDPTTIARAIMGEATLDGQDPEMAAKSIIARILLAETAEAALEQADIVGAEVMLNANLEVRGIKWMPSAYEKGPKCYAILDTVDTVSGQARAVSCGAATVLAQLLRLQVGNAFPCFVKIVQSQRATAAGNYPMWLEKGQDPKATGALPF